MVVPSIRHLSHRREELSEVRSPEPTGKTKHDSETLSNCNPKIGRVELGRSTLAGLVIQ